MWDHVVVLLSGLASHQDLVLVSDGDIADALLKGRYRLASSLIHDRHISKNAIEKLLRRRFVVLGDAGKSTQCGAVDGVDVPLSAARGFRIRRQHVQTRASNILPVLYGFWVPRT